MRFDSYDNEGFYDEMFAADGSVRPECRALRDRIHSLSDGDFKRRHKGAERALMRMGITFNVYGSEQATERIFPFDILPRIVPAEEWAVVEKGLHQRIRALNLYIDDVNHAQKSSTTASSRGKSWSRHRVSAGSASA